MAITNPGASEQLDAVLAKAQKTVFTKGGTTMKAANTYHSFWRNPGYPLAGNLPGAANVPTKSTLGAVPLVNFGTNTGYLCTFAAYSNQSGTLHLGDRLLHCSGLVSNITTVQPVANVPINRNITAPNLLFIEHYSPSGATASNITINYTNLDNVAKSVTLAFGTTSTAGQMQLVPINDVGVLSIQSVQLSASTTVAGDFGLTIVDMIEMFPILANSSANRLGVNDTALPEVHKDACLFYYWAASGTVQVVLSGKMAIGNG